MKILHVQSDEELQLALSRINEIWEVAVEGTPEFSELDHLATLVNDYEDKLIIEERKNQPEIKVSINDL